MNGNTAGSGLRVCAGSYKPSDDEEEDEPAPKKQSGPRINSRFPGGARPVAKKMPRAPCAGLSGETRNQCLGIKPKQQPSKNPIKAVHGTAKCACLSGATKCACLGIDRLALNVMQS